MRKTNEIKERNKRARNIDQEKKKKIIQMFGDNNHLSPRLCNFRTLNLKRFFSLLYFQF